MTVACKQIWYGIKAAANDSIDVSIFDEIGAYGISAADFIENVNGHEGITEINLSIHSPGGSVFDGLAIYNALKNHPATVNVDVAGLAASIASVIAMAGDTITMPEDSFMMVHCPRGGAVGEAGDMRDYADLLDQAENTMSNIYAKKTGLSRDEIAPLLSSETWMSGPECVEKGFADKLAEPIKAAATVNPEAFDLFASLPAGAKTLIGNTEASTEAKQINALLADKTRRDEIEAIVEPFKENPDVSALVESGELNNLPTNEARDLVMTALGKNKTPSGAAPSHIHVGNGEIVKDSIRNSVAARVGLESVESGNRFTGMRLYELAAASLEHHGVGIAELRANPVALVGAAFTHHTGDFGNALQDNINKAMLKGYTEAPETFSKWTTKGTLNNFFPGTRINMSVFPSLREVPEGAEYKSATMADSGEKIVLLTYGELFSITRQAIINDDLAVFSTMPQAMGRAAIRTVGDLVYAVVIDNPAMSDGDALFHASHGNLSADVLDVDGMAAARQMMRKQTAPGGGVLNIAPKHIIVPTDLEAQAYKVVNSSALPGTDSNSGIANPVNSIGEVLVEPRLDGSPDDWFMVGGGDNPCVEVAYLGGTETPYLEQQSGFTVDGVAYKVRLDVGVAPVDHRPIVKCTGGMPA